MNIYLKLIAPSFISFVLVYLGYEIYWVPTQLEKERTSYVSEINSLLSSSDSALVLNLLEKDFASLYSNMDDLKLKNEDSWHDVMLVNAEGKRIYPLFLDASTPMDSQSDESIIDIDHPISIEGENIANIYVTADWGDRKKQVFREISQIRNLIVGSLLLALLLGILSIHYIVIRPLRKLKVSALEIASGNLDRNIDIGGVDEVGDLARSFDKMLMELRFQKRALNEHAVVYITDGRGNFTDVNSRFCELSGYDGDEFLNKNYRMMMPGTEPDEFYDAIWATVRAGNVWNGEVCNKGKSGSLFWLNSTIIPFVDGRGAPTRYLSISTDVSNLKKIELELIKARDSAEKSSEAKSQFLSSMSHELRTPLNAIIGFSQLMTMSENLRDGEKEDADEILKAGRHLLTLINDVLDLSKIESGKIELSIESVPLKPLLEECFSLIEPLAAKRDIQVSYDISTSRMVQGDYTRLKQALLNLLSNAVKYNKDHGRVDVHIKESPDLEFIRLSVSDTGMGFSSDKLTRLFQPFDRLGAEGGTIEGTGIGLTITQRLVESMGGDIEVASEPGVGSTFSIELPVSKDDPANCADDDDSERSCHESLSRLGTEPLNTVLYIEDNPANLKLVSQMISRQFSATVLSAHNGELGIESAIEHRPTLILLDINMPGLDGYQVLTALRQEPSLRDTPIVAVTANAMPKDIERGLAAGFDAYLTKPLDFTVFNDVVSRFLQA